MINDQSIVSTHQSSIFSRHAVITFFLTCMRFFLVDMYALLSWHALFSRHSVFTFFSTLGDHFFWTCNVGATGWEPSDIFEDPSGRVGKRREAWVNPWELSGTVGNHHFEFFLHVFVTKSVKFGRTEVSIAPIDAKFQDLSFGKGPGAWFFEKYMVFVKTLSIFDRFFERFRHEIGREGVSWALAW